MDKTHQTIRLTGLMTAFNAALGTIDVEAYSDDIHDFVVITEPFDNPGASITNSAETYCPMTAQALNLDWSRCIFIESYPANVSLGHHDPTYDLIKFAEPPKLRSSPYKRNQTPFARLAQPGWARLPLELAQALQNAGCQMTSLLGKVVCFHDPGPETKRYGHYQVMGYDGRCYYTEGGVFLPHHINSTKPKQSSSLGCIDSFAR